MYFIDLISNLIMIIVALVVLVFILLIYFGKTKLEEWKKK